MENRPTSLTIIREIKAKPEQVFAALTIPEKMLNWWRVDNGKTISVDADVRINGKFNIVFETNDGQRHNPTGVYKEIIPNEKLVFTWEWPGAPEFESIVTFTLKPIIGGTLITLVHEKLPDFAVESHEIGWSGLLNQLEIYTTED